MSGIRIRPERAADIASIHAVNRAAFETGTEADLVDALRGRAEPIVSLVADEGGSIVGHILFSNPASCAASRASSDTTPRSRTRDLAGPGPGFPAKHAES